MTPKNKKDASPMERVPHNQTCLFREKPMRSDLSLAHFRVGGENFYPSRLEVFSYVKFVSGAV